MVTTALPSIRRGYWDESRAPRYSLLFALPLLVLYEVLAFALTSGSGGIRNGADVILRGLFGALAGNRGPLLFAAVVGVVLLGVAIRDLHRAGAKLKSGVFLLMLVESTMLAMVFGVVVGTLTAQLLGPMGRLAMGPIESLGWPTALMVSLGAGLYEEILFRVILVSAIVLAMRKLLGWGPVAANTAAVLGGALIFSAFHYIGPYGDPVEVQSFMFRTIAGVAFSGLYLIRGFGITAWTHALYDVMLLVVWG